MQNICIFLMSGRVQHSSSVNDCHWSILKKQYHSMLCIVPLSSHSALLKRLFIISVVKQKPVWNMLLSRVTVWNRKLETENKRLVFLRKDNSLNLSPSSYIRRGCTKEVKSAHTCFKLVISKQGSDNYLLWLFVK